MLSTPSGSLARVWPFRASRDDFQDTHLTPALPRLPRAAAAAKEVGFLQLGPPEEASPRRLHRLRLPGRVLVLLLVLLHRRRQWDAGSTVRRLPGPEPHPGPGVGALQGPGGRGLRLQNWAAVAVTAVTPSVATCWESDFLLALWLFFFFACGP